MPSASTFDTPISPRTSSEFEEVTYPTYTDHHSTEELPLHYMEDKARRRIKGPSGSGIPDQDQNTPGYQDEDGKDVYGKLRPPRQTYYKNYPPPPTNIVSASYATTQRGLNRILDRVLRTKPRAPPSHHIHSPFMLDTFPSNRPLEYRRLG
jgi:hypothetical protein